MIKYIIKRLLLGILVLFGVTVITFSITHLLPSDPARSWAGAKATEEQVEAAELEQVIEKINREMRHFMTQCRFRMKRLKWDYRLSV